MLDKIKNVEAVADLSGVTTTTEKDVTIKCQMVLSVIKNNRGYNAEGAEREIWLNYIIWN